MHRHSYELHSILSQVLNYYVRHRRKAILVWRTTVYTLSFLISWIWILNHQNSYVIFISGTIYFKGMHMGIFFLAPPP